jgi:two-component system, OmpR family, aerobic respiration control sensor histidine kinase ArcB
MTKPKNSEIDHAVKHMRVYFESIIAHMPGHLYWKDVDGRYIGCNKSQAEAAGLSDPSLIVGKTDAQMPWGSQAEYLRDIDRHVMQSRKVHTVEEEFILPDGTNRLFLSKKVPLFDEKNDVTGILGISFDITEKRDAKEKLEKAMNKAEEANLAKSEFIKNMSHDIRTPLAGMIALSESLVDRSTDPELKNDAQQLLEASHQLLKLLNEVLELARFDISDPRSETQSFNLPELTQSLLQLLTPLANKKALDMRLHIDKNLPEQMLGQPILLHRTLLNIISNAIKFTKTGHVELSCTLKIKDDENILVNFTITDTGIGMSDDVQSNIFLPFHKASPSFEGKYQGLGLGLYIAKQFVEQQNGTITLHSEPGQGSRFTCSIPFTTTQKSAIETTAYGPIDTAYHPKALKPSIEKKLTPHEHIATILLVEDTPIAQRAAQLKLQSLNCQIDIANNGRQAIEKIKSSHYDLIYMDIGLPDISGYIVTEAIRVHENENSLKHTPIIALTAHVDEDDEKRCYEAGMQFVVHKPLLSDYAERLLEKFVLKKKITPIKHKAPAVENPVEWEDAIKALGSLETAKEMFHMFLKELPDYSASLQEAYDNNDMKSLKETVHKINGAASYAPVPRLKKSAQALETYLKKNDSDKIKNEISIINHEIELILKHGD